MRGDIDLAPLGKSPLALVKMLALTKIATILLCLLNYVQQLQRLQHYVQQFQQIFEMVPSYFVTANIIDYYQYN